MTATTAARKVIERQIAEARKAKAREERGMECMK
jgi:hypothetical protein